MSKLKNDFRKYYKSREPYNMTAFDDIISEVEAHQSPYILEERKMNVTQMDIFSRLMRERQIFFASPVTDESASITVAQLLYLDSISNEDIIIYIMSPGGSVHVGMGVIDTMHFIKSDIKTINAGIAASMGSLLLAAGTRGKRFSLPNATVLIHQPLISGGISGPAADIIIEAENLKIIRERLFKYLAQRTGQTYEKILTDAARDLWLSAEESKEYGVIDAIIATKLD